MTRSGLTSEWRKHATAAIRADAACRRSVSIIAVARIGYVSTRSGEWPTSSPTRSGGAFSISLTLERPTNCGSLRFGGRLGVAADFRFAAKKRLTASASLPILTAYPTRIALMRLMAVAQFDQLGCALEGEEGSHLRMCSPEILSAKAWC